MKLKDIRAALREQYRPDKDTTYWLQPEILTEEREEFQDQYLSGESSTYGEYHCLRVDVKAYVPEIPDKTGEHKEALLARFPAMVFEQDDERVTGRMSRGTVDLVARMRTYNDSIALTADGHQTSCYGGGNSVQEAVDGLRAALEECAEECALVREVL